MNELSFLPSQITPLLSHTTSQRTLQKNCVLVLCRHQTPSSDCLSQFWPRNEIPQTEGLKQTFTSHGGWKSQNLVAADVRREPASWLLGSPLFPHMAESKEQLRSLLETPILPEGSVPGRHLIPTTAQRPHLHIPSHWGNRVPTQAFWEDTSIQSIRVAH